MHTIKSAARRHAWYSSNDSSENLRQFNMFSRYGGGNRVIGDEERPSPRTRHSETSAPAPMEQQRQQEKAVTTDGLTPKYGTYGGSSRPSTAPREVPEETTEESQFFAEPEAFTHEKNGRDGEFSDSTKAQPDERYAETPVGSDDTTRLGPRQRKGVRKFFHLKHSGETDEEMSRTQTNASSASRNSKGKKKHPKIPVVQQFKAVFFSWINIMLVFVPVGIALNYAGINKTVVFVMNFLAIIPLAAMLSFATEELAMYVGETLGGLLNATFGNAVELIVSIIALAQGKYVITQTSLIGSMLSNLLLVLGMCFFFGGLRRKEQFFNITVAQTAASLLALAVGSLIIPTAFRIFAERDEGVTPTSRGTAVMLLVVYGCYLYFQLKTHIDMYNEPSQKVPKNKSGKKEKGDVSRGLATMGIGTGAAAAGGGISGHNVMSNGEEEDAEIPQLSIVGGLATLTFSTVLVALCAEYMVSAIDVLAESVSEEFIGLILIPIVGNAAEHATAVTVAVKDKMDLAIGVAIGSSLQIALLVLPLMVIIGWIGLEPRMTLNFDGFQITVLFVSIIIVNYLIQDGKSHWLEGAMLQITYLIIAVAAWFYPYAPEVPS